MHFFAQVQMEGKRQVERQIPIYNLDMIISVGYRVNSHRGVQFRQWATQVLKEYMIKGFALNDDLLKNAGRISAEVARLKANEEYDKFRERTQYQLSPVEIHFLETFDAEQKKNRAKQ